MSRFTAVPAVSNNRERLKQEHRNAVLLRMAYPALSQLHVELDFDDGTERPPSLQIHDYFPGARSLFRYPCPCHACDGDFDLSAVVAELVGGHCELPVRNMTIACTGQRLHLNLSRSACPIRAGIRIRATWRTGVQS